VFVKNFLVVVFLLSIVAGGAIACGGNEGVAKSGEGETVDGAIDPETGAISLEAFVRGVAAGKYRDKDGNAQKISVVIEGKIKDAHVDQIYGGPKIFFTPYLGYTIIAFTEENENFKKLSRGQKVVIHGELRYIGLSARKSEGKIIEIDVNDILKVLQE